MGIREYLVPQMQIPQTRYAYELALWVNDPPRQTTAQIYEEVPNQG